MDAVARLAALGLTPDDLRAVLAEQTYVTWTDAGPGRWTRAERGQRWFKLAGDRLGAELHLFDDQAIIHISTAPPVPLAQPAYPLDGWALLRTVSAPELVDAADDQLWRRLEREVA